ncbi:MAG: hypothetical protein R6W06_05525 [Prochlorococcaceae cyanobacterium]
MPATFVTGFLLAIERSMAELLAGSSLIDWLLAPAQGCLMEHLCGAAVFA